MSASGASLGARPDPFYRDLSLALAVSLLLGLWFALSREQSWQYADAVVPVLVGLVKWTPFYWYEYRFGMLVPLLISPLRDPLAAFVVQNALTGALGVLGILLLPTFVGGQDGPLAGILSVTLFVGLAPASLRFEFLAPSQPYGTALALALVGLLLLERYELTRARATCGVGVLLVVLAHWVNPTVAFVLIPTLVLERWFRRAPIEASGRRALAALGGATFLAFLWLELHGDRASVGLAKVATWGEGLVTLLSNLGHEPGALIWLAVPVVATATALLSWPRVRLVETPAGRPGHRWASGVALLVAGVSYVLLVATLKWVRVNAYGPRYLLPGLLCLEAGGVRLALGRLGHARAFERRAATLALAVVGLGLVSLVELGVPQPSLPRALLSAQLGAATPELVARGCTHLVGDYSRVWPSVLDVTIERGLRGDPAPLWGVSFRSEATEELWRATPESSWRLCAFAGDPQAEKYRRAFRLDGFRLDEVGGSIEVWRQP